MRMSVPKGGAVDDGAARKPPVARLTRAAVLGSRRIQFDLRVLLRRGRARALQAKDAHQRPAPRALPCLQRTPTAPGEEAAQSLPHNSNSNRIYDKVVNS